VNYAPLRSSGSLEWHGVRSGLSRRVMAQPLNQPRGVVTRDELSDRHTCLVETLKLMQIQTLLLQGPHEPFGHPVAWGLADVGWRDRDAKPFHFVDPGGRKVLLACGNGGFFDLAPDPTSVGIVLGANSVSKETGSDLIYHTGDPLVLRSERSTIIDICDKRAN
jgi:hypothetical protein